MFTVAPCLSMHASKRQRNAHVDTVKVLVSSRNWQVLSASCKYTTSLGCQRGVDAVIWWKGIRKSSVPKEFTDIALQLLNAPSSSASIERVFSSFGLIHTKVRNRLGNEKASKLVFCYRMLRGTEELDY